LTQSQADVHGVLFSPTRSIKVLQEGAVMEAIKNGCHNERVTLRQPKGDKYNGNMLRRSLSRCKRGSA